MVKKLTKNDKALGKRIKKGRKQAGITQEKLAEKVRRSTTHIGLIETGKRHVSFETLKRIASALGVKTKDLIPF